MVPVGLGAAVILAGAACHRGGPAPEPAPVPVPVPVPAPAPAPSAPDTVDGLVRALSARDGEPDCAAVTAALARPAEALLTVVREVEMPPTAPMRAAGCLPSGHAADPMVSAAVLAWVSDPGTRGLALLVGQHLGRLPDDLAVAVAKAGAAGPWSADLSPAIGADPRPEVRAVIPETPSEGRSGP